MLRPLQEESTHTPLKLSAKPCSHGSAHVSRPGLCSQEAWAASEGHSSSMKGGTPGRHCGATTWACVAHPGSCVLSTANEAHGGEAEGRIEGRRWREVGGLSAGRGPPGAARRLPGRAQRVAKHGGSVRQAPRPPRCPDSGLGKGPAPGSSLPSPAPHTPRLAPEPLLPPAPRAALMVTMPAPATAQGPMGPGGGSGCRPTVPSPEPLWGRFPPSLS